MIRPTILLLCVCYTTMAGGAVVELSEADNGRVLAAQVGDLLRIRLAENASTGYRWDLESASSDVLEALESDVAYPPSVVGASGTVTFSFRARQPGQGELRLRHWRRWQGDASVTRRFRLTLHVRPMPSGP